MISTVNPSNGEKLNSYEEMSQEQIISILNKTDSAFHIWRRTSFETRAQHMLQLSKLLEERKEDLSRLMTLEMGKPISQARSEVEKCQWVCEYYAENAERFLTDQDVNTDTSHCFVTFQPIGIVLAVMPWNFPLWQVFRFAAPTLMAGNASVLKHASSVMGCSLEIERLFKGADFPENLFRSLVISSKQVEPIIENKLVRAVTLTGSTDAGRKVASLAGHFLKKSVLELGGSDAYIVLEDADIEKAAKICAQSRMMNNGQSCIAAKRFIVVEAVYDEFLSELKSQMATYQMGDPLLDETKLGPLSSIVLRDELHDQVIRSIDMGAICILGGEVPDKLGAWYPATILTDLTEDMPAYSEELFGPVASVIKASGEAHAIDIANSSNFGLGGGIFTKNETRGQRIARDELDTGAVAINGFVKSDPRLPFGGVKDSGYGRELSHFGIHEFVNIKSVTVE